MPQIRYVCLQGDPITGGGQVREGIGHDKAYIDGKEPTADGLKGWCNVCKSMGVIRCVGPRPSHAPDNIHGYKLALNGDYLICQCPKPQKLMNTSTAWEVIITEGDSSAWGEPLRASAYAAGTTLLNFNDRYRLYCESTGSTLANTEYMIIKDGKTTCGTTDAFGCTDVLIHDSDTDVEIYI